MIFPSFWSLCASYSPTSGGCRILAVCFHADINWFLVASTCIGLFSFFAGISDLSAVCVHLLRDPRRHPDVPLHLDGDNAQRQHQGRMESICVVRLLAGYGGIQWKLLLSLQASAKKAPLFEFPALVGKFKLNSLILGPFLSLNPVCGIWDF